MPKIYFTVLYISFFISIFYLRIQIRNRTLKREKVPGKIVGKWTSKYIFYLYMIIFFGSFLEYFIAGREINILLSFLKQLNTEEQPLIQDYLKEKSLESLSKAFDKLVESPVEK